MEEVMQREAEFIKWRLESVDETKSFVKWFGNKTTDKVHKRIKQGVTKMHNMMRKTKL